MDPSGPLDEPENSRSLPSATFQKVKGAFDGGRTSVVSDPKKPLASTALFEAAGLRWSIRSRVARPAFARVGGRRNFWTFCPEIRTAAPRRTASQIAFLRLFVA
jgi:hypothetical protein